MASPAVPDRDPAPPAESADLARQLRSLQRLALAVARRGGPALHEELVTELAQALGVAVAFVGVFTDASRQALRTLAAHLDGQALRNFEYALEGSPCAQVVDRFRYVAQGVSAEFRPDTVFAAKGMDAYAAYPLADSDGVPLGLLVAMDRRPIAGGDAEHAEAMLKIVAGRLAGEIERSRTDAVLRDAALAVSGARGDTVFDELVRMLAAILGVEVAFIARHEPAERDRLRMLAMQYDGQILRDIPYATAGTPCETVLGQCFRAYPRDLQRLFPDDHDARAQGTESYAGYPLAALDGRPLGIVSVASRQPLLQLERVEAMLKIFAVRAAAELERLAASEALARSEASYRAIFEAAEDAIFIHDWDSGRILDVNAKAVETYGWSREEFARLGVDDISAGTPPYTAAEAMHWMGLAKLGRCPPVEWRRRNRDGSLHWDEVRLKPALIEGRPQVLAFTRDITERRAADQALRDSEAQYRAIFNASADALVLRDAEFRIVDVNATYERMSGFSRDEVIGVDHVLANPMPMHAQIRALHERALAGEAVTIETQLLRRDGIGYELELRGVPTPHRGLPHVLYIGRDITERKRAERALRASEAQYRAIFNVAADALILWNSRYERVDVNDAYERLYGWTRGEVIGRGFDIQRYTPEQAHPRRELVRRALAGERCSAEVEAVCKDGRRILTEVQAIPFRHRGEPHVLAIARDVTERRQAEQALRASEAQYRAIFNASADALVLRDADYHAVDVNPAYLAMTGYTRDEVLGAPRVLTQDDPALRALHRRQHDDVLAGQALRFEAAGRRKDGAELTLEVHAMPVMHRGQPHVLYAARDITERRAAEAQRSELERQLRQAQKMEAIGQLTGGIAHDFNNILTSVIGWQAMAQERAEAIGDTALQRQVAQGRLAAERARDLVAQMLAFARRQRGERRSVALAPLVRRTLGLLRATLPATLTLRTEGLDAPSADDGPQVLADPVQLEQVLFNLCINARDAMPGGGRLEVRLELSSDAPRWHCASCRARVAGGAWVRLAVQDDGDGIAPALVERIFDPFFSTKAPGRGSGMGLAMVHGIVHGHGGHLGLTTAPGAGACFEVWLPRAGADATDDVQAARPVPAAAPALQGRVLLVEDDAMVGEYLAERLRGWGLTPTWMRDPLAALQLLRDPAQRFALLITDQTMPGLTGLQLAEQAGALRPALPRLLISGNAEAFEADALQRAGVVAALPKPLDEARLRSQLPRWLATDTDTLHTGG